MTATEVRNAIMARYLNEFSGQFVIALDNQLSETADKWVRLTVNFNDGSQNSFGTTGTRKFTRRGLIIVQVFTPVNTGTDENDDLAVNSANLFDGVRLQDLWMYNGRIVTVGADGEYYQQNAIIEFEYEDIR
jgi:hypothetical protein